MVKSASVAVSTYIYGITRKDNVDTIFSLSQTGSALAHKEMVNFQIFDFLRFLTIDSVTTGE